MPSHPAPAATVMLLRDGCVSPEVLMLERHAKSEVLPTWSVFPGGRVEDQDHALAPRLGGFSDHQARHKLMYLDPEAVSGFFVAAIRETFEEAGVLLVRRRGASGLLHPDEVAPLLRHRLELQSGRLAFPELIENENLELAAECLTVHGHWITPEAAPRRFDTLFFTALTPSGQLAHHDGVEASAHIWIRPEDALDQRRRGERQIIFPTACNLETLTGFPSAEQALEASRKRPVVPVQAVPVERDGRLKLVIPSEAGYSSTEDDVLVEAVRKP